MLKVSVIVPVYNVEKYLRRCLDSLVSQTLKEIEIIIVNDGSPDNSQKIIDEYQKKYPKIIRAFTKKNGGLSDARNFGMKRSIGEYIAFVDSDDYVDPDMFRKMYEKAKKDSLDIVTCSYYEAFEDGKTRYMKLPILSEDPVKNYIISLPMVWLSLIKKEVLDNTSFRKGIFYEDLDFLPTLALKTKKIGFLSIPLYYYVQREGSIMHQKELNPKMDDIFDVLANLKKKLGKKYPEEVEYLYITHLLRSSVLRYVSYPNSCEKIDRIVKIMKEQYPLWRKNIYYKKSSLKLKIICNLAILKQKSLLVAAKKITRK